jgi:hypothetical protein
VSDGGLPFRIRVLNGPLEDSRYTADDRIEIGRSDTADVQLSGRGVSRQHASVIASETGHVLLDMLSTNGTWCDGKRVTQHALRHGDRFVIDDVEFEFEIVHPTDPQADPPPTPHVARARIVRDTVDFKGPRRGVRRPPTPVPAPTALHRFVDGDGRDYGGNLLSDIMLYRNLRLRVVQRGDKAKPENLERFRRLDDKLRSPPVEDSDRREFARYSCEVPGTLRTESSGDDDRIDIVMVDVAVDGARIRGDGLPSDPKGLYWLSLPNLGADGLRCIVFTCRVAWASPGELGLVFSGAPSWATRDKNRAEDTQPGLRIALTKKKPARESG